MNSLLIIAVPVLGVLALPVVRAEMPELFKRKEFTSSILADAVNFYIELGEDRAIKELKILEEDFGASMKRGFHRNERIGWVCRIVFNGGPGKPLRPPMYGGLGLPRLTMPLERWYLYPVAESDGVFFVLSEGYSGTGIPESATSYIDYCRSAGSFRKVKVKVPTRAEAIMAFKSFKKSERWKMIKWKDEGHGAKYTMSEEWVLRDIEAQAASIPIN